MTGEEDFHGPERERLERPDVPEVCDLCGTVITDGTARYGIVPDSSTIHATDPALEGGRMVVACSPEHMQALHDQAAAGPWVEAEQWAGKLTRAFANAARAGLPDVTLDRLRAETGLTNDQIWQALEWLKRTGRLPDDDE